MHKSIRSALRIAIVLFAVVLNGSAASGATILLLDNFNSGILDPALWTTNTNIARGPASVVLQNQRVAITNRGHLITASQWNPISQPLEITGTWQFGRSGLPAGDFMQILTRSDGIPNNGAFGETLNGIQFMANANANNGGALAISSSVNGNGLGLATTNMLLTQGTTYSFDIRDDGTNLQFTMTNLANNATATVSAVSSQAFAHNHVVFHNREANNGVSETSYLDSVKIETVDTTGLVFHAPFFYETPHVVTQGPGGTFSHTGNEANDIDFAPQTSNEVPVVAALGGIAYVHPDKHPGEKTGFGNLVTIDHGIDPSDPSQHLLSIYAHLDQFRVENGQTVSTGDIIGVEGSTGFSTNRHLHFGVYRGDPADAFGWTPVGFAPNVASIELINSDGDLVLMHTADFADNVGKKFTSTTHPLDSSNWGGVLLASQSSIFSTYIDSPSNFVFGLTWPGSTLGLDIIQPNGETLRHLQGSAGDLSGSLSTDLVGVWSFKVTGIEVSDGGEPFSLQVDVQSVPEPGTLFLTSIGGIACAVVHLTRRRRTA